MTQPGNLYNRLPQSESSSLSLFEDRLVEAHCRFYGAGLSPLTTINEVLVLEAQSKEGIKPLVVAMWVENST